MTLSRLGVEGCVTLTNVLSKVRSASCISEGSNSGLLGGSGEGGRGPMGRRSEECWELEHELCRESLYRDGVVGLGVGVVDRRLAVSLAALDAGRVGCGGSSESEGQ